MALTHCLILKHLIMNNFKFDLKLRLIFSNDSRNSLMPVQLSCKTIMELTALYSAVDIFYVIHPSIC